MRRKSDMWQDAIDEGSFLPAESQQELQAVAADTRDRLNTLEDQLKSQFTSMATYAQIAQQSVETARAEARADLEREKATLVSLVERVRTECHGDSPRPTFAPPPTAVSAPSTDVSTLARIALIEDNVERLAYQFGQLLRSQEELATSIALMFEHQMRHSAAMAGAGS